MHLTHGLTRAAALKGDSTALCFEGRRRTWATLAQRCARLGGAFAKLGICPGERVAMLARNSDRYIEYYFATLWCGGIFAPLNHRWAQPEMVACLRNCTPRVLLVDRDFTEFVEPLKAATDGALHIVYADDGEPPNGMLNYEQLIEDTSPIADNRSGYDDVACLFYTSGATGQSKGVMLTHTNLVMNAMNTLPTYGYTESAVGLHAGPLFHLATGARVFTATFAMSRQVVLRHFDTQLLMHTIEKEQITTTQLIPTMASMLLDDDDFAVSNLSSLETVSYGGSPMPEAVLRRLLAKLPDVRFIQSYGMTETSPVVTTLGPEWHALEGPRAGKLNTSGRIVTNVDVRIVDDNETDVACGEVGEVLVRGPTVTKGYWDQPALTNEAIRNGWLHTGDMGYLDEDSFLAIVDRKKDMIISGGENVFSTEVENVLYMMSDVVECAVFGVPHEKWGEAVHAIVVPRNGQSLTSADIVAHCRNHIAGYKCPRSVEIRVSALPKNGANKIDKAALKRHFESSTCG